MGLPITQPDNRHACAACRQFGKNGANFRLVIDGKVMPLRYHKPCANEIAQMAPVSVTSVEVVPVWEIARRRRLAEEAARRERLDRAQQFWDRHAGD